MEWKQTHEIEFRLCKIGEPTSITLLPILETRIENGFWFVREHDNQPCNVGEGETLAKAVSDWLTKRIT